MEPCSAQQLHGDVQGIKMPGATCCLKVDDYSGVALVSLQDGIALVALGAVVAFGMFA